MKHVLGVVGTESYNFSVGKKEYMHKKIVDESVYEWLMNHDIEITAKGERTFKYNNVTYVDLGIYLEDTKIS